MDGALELSPPPPLARLMEERVLALFLDFDGTLVDIAPAPDEIVVPARLAERLRTLSRRLDGRLALITGRSLEDLAGHCPIEGIACAGSHGAARRDAMGQALGDAARPLPDGVFDTLHDGARDLGVALEAKTHGAALHFRADPGKAEQARAFAAEVASQHALAVKRGKGVVEITQAGADKGGAVREFMRHAPFVDTIPVFIGDDVTDEDGMAACNDAGGFGILVGDRSPTVAQFRLSDVPSVYEWLSL
ncbi:trehalose-phosphatase [Pelagerythrobacter marensis]|uniref:Trehalose 6-phosphate phosphatase n=1 Tax=Pelagerythrobacter marensis TaxID=543877 RepID=A0A0G3X8B1_9SPHN|nr:trehalose-phosphatase [Pelagerythrobacter marensis]AKM06854.1 Trehalose 6-phosphate phosphatase [Pelagerythrobacter marensis]